MNLLPATACANYAGLWCINKNLDSGASTRLWCINKNWTLVHQQDSGASTRIWTLVHQQECRTQPMLGSINLEIFGGQLSVPIIMPSLPHQYPVFSKYPPQFAFDTFSL